MTPARPHGGSAVVRRPPWVPGQAPARATQGPLEAPGSGPGPISPRGSGSGRETAAGPLRTSPDEGLPGVPEGPPSGYDGPTLIQRSCHALRPHEALDDPTIDSYGPRPLRPTTLPNRDAVSARTRHPPQPRLPTSPTDRRVDKSGRSSRQALEKMRTDCGPTVDRSVDSPPPSTRSRLPPTVALRTTPDLHTPSTLLNSPRAVAKAHATDPS